MYLIVLFLEILFFNLWDESERKINLNPRELVNNNSESLKMNLIELLIFNVVSTKIRFYNNLIKNKKL